MSEDLILDNYTDLSYAVVEKAISDLDNSLFELYVIDILEKSLNKKLKECKEGSEESKKDIVNFLTEFYLRTLKNGSKNFKDPTEEEIESIISSLLVYYGKIKDSNKRIKIETVDFFERDDSIAAMLGLDGEYILSIIHDRFNNEIETIDKMTMHQLNRYRKEYKLKKWDYDQE